MPRKGKGFKLELSSTKRPNRVQFIAMKEQIQEHLDLGYSGKDIYDELKKRKQIDYGYPMFMRYVKQFIKSPTDQNKKDVSESTEDKQSEKQPADYSPRNAKRNLL